MPLMLRTAPRICLMFAITGTVVALGTLLRDTTQLDWGVSASGACRALGGGTSEHSPKGEAGHKQEAYPPIDGHHPEGFWP